MRPVCSIEDIPENEGRVVLVGGVRVAIFRVRDGYRAVDADCPHKGGPLIDGIVADASVTCPLHLRRFSLDTGEPLGHDCARLTVHAVAERGGQLFVELTREALRQAA